MAAIVTGSTLGLNLTSWATLGRHGPPADAAADGRHGELAVVNAATGNLVLQQQDDLLVARGGGTAAVRTYNSQGRFTDDNGDNWSVGVHAQRLRLAGPPGAAGSSIVRTDRDGGEATYAWDASRAQYVATAGDGAHDTIVFDAARSRHVRTDGSTGQQEHYDAAGRLVATVDASGHATSYAYGAGGLLASVTTAAGEQTLYDYSGRDLVQVRTVVDGGLGTLTRVRYAYDASHRLASVIVDLSPADGSVADGRCFVTTYGYDGDSTRLVSVGRSDG
ncbi:MAG TPA: RHS repeat domain-containing protein, partial [Albitalea sp.]